MSVEAGDIASGVYPGQFIHAEAPGRSLRRAFSVFSVSGDSLSIIYRVRGKGTRAISALGKGGILDILGPLGKGFPRPGENPLFLAGGLGAAPLGFLASKTSGGGFLYGAERECDFIPEELLNIPGHTLIRVCRGSSGETVTDILPEYLNGAGALYAAGPTAMLKKAAGVSRGKLKTFVSWEETLGCGTGLCMGCAVKTLSGYKMTCSDGPVFDAEEIDWDAC